MSGARCRRRGGFECAAAAVSAHSLTHARDSCTHACAHTALCSSAPNHHAYLHGVRHAAPLALLCTRAPVHGAPSRTPMHTRFPAHPRPHRHHPDRRPCRRGGRHRAHQDPACFIPRYHLGRALLDAGRPVEAATQLKEAATKTRSGLDIIMYAMIHIIIYYGPSSTRKWQQPGPEREADKESGTWTGLSTGPDTASCDEKEAVEGTRHCRVPGRGTRHGTSPSLQHLGRVVYQAARGRRGSRPRCGQADGCVDCVRDERYGARAAVDCICFEPASVARLRPPLCLGFKAVM